MSQNWSIVLSLYCVFQDLATRKMILTTKEQSGLYVLESNDSIKTWAVISQGATTKT